MTFKQYIYLNENKVDTNDIIRKGKKIALSTMNPLAGHYYVDYKDEAWWIKGNTALNQGDTKEFIKKVKAGKLRFVELIK